MAAFSRRRQELPLGSRRRVGNDSCDKSRSQLKWVQTASCSYGHPEVQEDVLAWAKWIVELLNLKGFRFDAVPHVRLAFACWKGGWRI